MEFDPTMQEGLRRSSARFIASMTRIIEHYNHPFRDDILISMDSLTYDTPEGPKRWDHMSRKDVKTWKKGFTHVGQRPRSTEKQSRDFEDENSAEHQESSENSGADTSDTGEEGGDVASVGRKFKGIRLKNLNVESDGQILKKKRVPVDVILQGDERNIPKWITITTPPSLSKRRRSALPGRELLEKQSRDFEDENSAEHQESSENSGADTSDTGEEGGDVASVGRKFKGIRLKNLNVESDGQILKKKRVPVDVILQGDERNIPKWITITTPPSLSKRRRSALPGRELLEKQSRDFEDENSAEHQESSENSGADTSDTGEEGGDVASVGRKFKGIRLKNLNVESDGQILKKKRVPVDVILQGDERNIPKWITITTPPSLSKCRRSTLPGRELLEKQSRDFEDENSAEHQESSENSGADTSDTGEEGGDVASVGRKFKGIRLKNLNVESDGQILKKKRVPVDVILQGDERNIPKWITITTPPSLSKRRRSALPGRELLGNQATVCRKKLEFSNECSSSKYPQLQHSAVPIPSNTVASPRHQLCPELSITSCDSILGEYQSADEECSLSSTTLSGLYPAMVAILTKLMTKHSQRKVLKYMFGHLRSKRRHSRRPKLSVTAHKITGFRPCKCKPKKAFHSMCSRRSEDNQNPTFGNESREFCYDSCPISNSSGLVPHACADTNEIKMHYSDSSLEQHLASGKRQEVCKHTAFPDVMDRMGETFLVEDKLQAIASPKNSEYIEGEKFTYKCFSEPSFITSTASSDSRAFHLVEESKTQKTDFCVGTSELCSSACSSHDNRNNSIPTTNCSPARSSNTMFICPQKITSFQHKKSFSSWKQNPSKRDEEIDAAFDKLYYRVISGEYFKPLTLTRPLLNSQNHEEKGTLVKSNLSDSERSLKQCGIEFEKLCGKSVPKSPGLQRTSNFRKYEEIQMPETVNALVNSPVRTYSAISSAKRAGNFQNHPLCSPVKRLKFIPEYCFSSSKCREISHSKEGNLQIGGMDFLSTYNCSKPSFFADCNCHCQVSGSHDSSQQSFLGISGTSLQESGTAGAHSGWLGAMENCSSLRNVSKHHPRVYRKLSYTDGKDQL
ncbi:Holliday junction recognition protein [Molothrus aeneus]|uniref:Holliday junction recognition protein n=1 Tax=Molothrus aeneus TaxID=84833 RepID=UPI003459AFC3